LINRLCEPCTNCQVNSQTVNYLWRTIETKKKKQ
jgi:hypothetical protein